MNWGAMVPVVFVVLRVEVALVLWLYSQPCWPVLPIHTLSEEKKTLARTYKDSVLYLSLQNRSNNLVSGNYVLSGTITITVNRSSVRTSSGSRQWLFRQMARLPCVLCSCFSGRRVHVRRSKCSCVHEHLVLINLRPVNRVDISHILKDQCVVCVIRKISHNNTEHVR